MLDTIRATIERYQMLKPRDRILVGVSGGPDSMALLTALVALRREYRVHLNVVYVNHGLRPAEARREAAWVKKVAQGWAVPTDLVHAVVLRRGGQSLEAVAREARYKQFTKTARRRRCNVVAVGHTQDDQAETVLMWMIRGTGTTGLAGIPPVRKLASGGRTVRLIRPLMDCSRTQVVKFLQAHRVESRKDRSNDSLQFLRNRIRKNLIPLLEREYNPRVREHLTQLAQTLQGDLALLEHQFDEEFARVARVGNGRVRLERLRLRLAPEALRRGVVRWAVKKLKGDCQGFSASHWKAVENLLLNGAKAVDLPHHIRAEVTDEKTLILRVNKV